MDFSHYKGDAGVLAIDLVNTRDAHSGDDSLTNLDDLEQFIESHRDSTYSAGWHVDRLRTSDVAEVVAVREKLRAVFESADDAEATERINELLREVSATPRVSLHAGHPHLHFEAADTSLADSLGAAAAMAVAIVLVEEGFDRTGRCHSSTCDDVYIDTSKNRSRRFCSDTCSTREAVAAYRKRTREAG